MKQITQNIQFLRYIALLILLSGCGKVFSQNVIQDVNLVCDDQSIGVSIPQQTEFTQIRVCSSVNLTNRIEFYLVYIQSGTTFTFEIAPSINIDYDFASWLNPNLENIGVPDRGSLNNPNLSGIYTTGLSLDDPEECEEAGVYGNYVPGKVRYYDVQPGDRVLIAVGRWSGVEAGYDLTFGGDAVLGCLEIANNNYVVCDADDDGEEVFDIDAVAADIQEEDPSWVISIYEEYDNALAGNGIGMVNGSHAFEIGDHVLIARVEDSNGIMVKLLLIYFIVYEPLHCIDTTDEYFLCDADDNGEEEFDLNIIISDIQEEDPSWIITLYEEYLNAYEGNGVGVVTGFYR